VSQPLYIVAQAMANQSTLGVIGPFSIVVNILFGRIFLKEKATALEYFGILLFIPGSIVTLQFATKTNNLLNREEFNEVFFSPLSMTYLGVHFVLSLFLYFLSRTIMKHHPVSDVTEAVPESVFQEETTEQLLGVTEDEGYTNLNEQEASEFTPGNQLFSNVCKSYINSSLGSPNPFDFLARHLLLDGFWLISYQTIYPQSHTFMKLSYDSYRNSKYDQKRNDDIEAGGQR